jgi:adenylate kinase family enzyme
MSSFNDVGIILPMEHDTHVILLAGPAGSGKTTTASRIADHPDWVHLSEDDHWVKIKEGRPADELRTADEEKIVQSEVLRRVIATLADHKKVVLEFILYEDPPHPLLSYQKALTVADIPFTTKILRPNVEEILRRIKIRGRDTESDIAQLRADAAHQVQCLGSSHIQSDWVIDTTDIPLEEVYEKHFKPIVEKK